MYKCRASNTAPLLLILYRKTGIQNRKNYFVERFLVFQKHVHILFASYMDHFMHINPYLSPKDLIVFHNNLCLAAFTTHRTIKTVISIITKIINM